MSLYSASRQNFKMFYDALNFGTGSHIVMNKLFRTSLQCQMQ